MTTFLAGISVGGGGDLGAKEVVHWDASAAVFLLERARLTFQGSQRSLNSKGLSGPACERWLHMSWLVGHCLESILTPLFGRLIAQEDTWAVANPHHWWYTSAYVLTRVSFSPLTGVGHVSPQLLCFLSRAPSLLLPLCVDSCP